MEEDIEVPQSAEKEEDRHLRQFNLFSKLNTAECYIVVLLLAAGRLKYLFNVYACCRQLIKHIEGDGVEGGLHLLLKNCQLSVCIIT